MAPVSRRGLINMVLVPLYHSRVTTLFTGSRAHQPTPPLGTVGLSDSGQLSLLGQLPVRRTTETCQCPRWVQSSDGHRHRPLFGLSERDNLFFASAVLVGGGGH